MLSQASGPDVCLAHTHGPPLHRPLCPFIIFNYSGSPLCSFVVLRGLCDSPAGQIFHSSPTTPPVARLPRVLWPWKVCRFAPARSVLCSPFSGARKRPFVSSWKTKKAPRTAPFGSDLLQPQRAAAALATRALKPSVSAIAISESILRLTVMPALVRPSMKRE